MRNILFVLIAIVLVNCAGPRQIEDPFLNEYNMFIEECNSNGINTEYFENKLVGISIDKYIEDELFATTYSNETMSYIEVSESIFIHPNLITIVLYHEFGHVNNIEHLDEEICCEIMSTSVMSDFDYLNSIDMDQLKKDYFNLYRNTSNNGYNDFEFKAKGESIEKHCKNESNKNISRRHRTWYGAIKK